MVWLLTMVIVSPVPYSWGCGTPSKWPHFGLYSKWGVANPKKKTNWDDPPSGGGVPYLSSIRVAMLCSGNSPSLHEDLWGRFGGLAGFAVIPMGKC